jgi:PEP-CTERM motif
MVYERGGSASIPPAAVTRLRHDGCSHEWETGVIPQLYGGPLSFQSSFQKLSSFLCLSLFLSAAGATYGQSAGYSYSFSGPGISGSGDVYLTGTATDGVYAVQSISGEINGIQISGLLAAGAYDNNDNLFYDNDTFLDDNGVGFSLTNGANVDINFNPDIQDYYFQGDGTFEIDGGDAPQPEVQSRTRSFFEERQPETSVALDSFTFAPLEATPEPSGLVLLGTGLAGLAGMARRKK